MAKLPSNFNADEHDEMNDFDALPAGEYQAKVKSTEVKRNSKDTGDIYKFVFEITKGEYKGRLLFSNLNLVHNNPSAVEMAEKELATMCKAAGRISIKDTEDLHGCEMMLKVIVKPATPQYAAGNEIKNYIAIAGIAQPKSPSSKASMTDEAVQPKKKKVSFD